MRGRIGQIARKLRDKFLAAWPVIAFFLVLFYSTLALFGISQAMLVSVVTVLFKLNYQKPITVRGLLVLAGTMYSMAALAFLATLNLVFCIALNLLVPFALVLRKVSQLTPMGYFGGAMCFTFLQLRPVGWKGLSSQLLALAFGLVLLTIGWLLFSRLRPGPREDHPERRGTALLARALGAFARGEACPGLLPELFEIQQALYREAYRQPRRQLAQNENYLAALLFQRAVYFLDAAPHLPAPGNYARALARDLAAFIARFGDSWTMPELLRPGEELLARAEQGDGTFCVFAQNFLRTLLSLIQNQMPGARSGRRIWRPVRNPFRRIRMDSFETRFALRLSVVLTVSFAYNVGFPSNHSYWLALNAFLLLRPLYEDSAHRLKTRFCGTVAGCVLVPILLWPCHGLAGHLVVASLLVIGLYMETPGTWTQALFSTGFALTLATLSISQTTAIGLRMIYVVVAALFVLLLNRFFFPVSTKTQFKTNLDLLFHLQHVYLHMAEVCLSEPPNYGAICQVQVEYHMLYSQLLEYLKQPRDGEDAAFYSGILATLWRMASEAEQMLLVLGERQDAAPNRRQMEDYLVFVSQVLNDVQHMLRVRPEKTPKACRAPLYDRKVENAPHLSALMKRYARLMENLYQTVCENRN